MRVVDPVWTHSAAWTPSLFVSAQKMSCLFGFYLCFLICISESQFASKCEGFGKTWLTAIFQSTLHNWIRLPLSKSLFLTSFDKQICECSRWLQRCLKETMLAVFPQSLVRADKFHPDGLWRYIFTEIIVKRLRLKLERYIRPPSAPQSCWRTDEHRKIRILVLTVDSSFCFLPHINSLRIPLLSRVQTTCWTLASFLPRPGLWMSFWCVMYSKVCPEILSFINAATHV